MTSYTIEIATVARNFVYIKFDEAGGNEPAPWDALLADASESVSAGDAVDIKRDGTTIFSGIVEVLGKRFGPDGAFRLVGGRHNKVKLWRKFHERYARASGFFTSMYLNKVIEFLLRPSFSEFDPSDYENYTAVGWGLDPRDWTVTAHSYYDSDDTYNAQHVANRVHASFWRSNDAQSSGDYVAIDLGAAHDLVGIIVECKPSVKTESIDSDTEFVRNYDIEVSTTGAWGGEEVTKASITNNKAINIIESWAPGTSYRYIRIKCTDTHSSKWSISNIYVFESDGAISGISVGTISEHYPLNVSKLTADPSPGSTCVVRDGWKFGAEDRVILEDDNSDGEILEVDSVSSNTVTFKSAFTGTYTQAQNATLTNYWIQPKLDLEYSRRLESIYTIVSLCTDDSYNPWVMEVTNAGVVNAGAQVGTDLTGSISFVEGTHIEEGQSMEDHRQKTDRVMVIGKGKGKQQDRNRSGWVGSGEYEHIEVDTSIETPAGARQRAEVIKQLNDGGVASESITVNDTYATNAWGVDDDITITSTILGLSGGYRVKKITRRYDSNGETTQITTTTREPDPNKAIKILKKMIDDVRMIDDRTEEEIQFIDISSGYDPRYAYKVEAEDLLLDSDVTIVTDLDASSQKYITMADSEAGDVILSGPSLSLEPGKYNVVFKSKVASISSGSDLVDLSISSNSKGSAFGTLTIQPNLYTANDTWEDISFNIVVEKKYDDVVIIVDNYVTSITDWSCDFIGFTLESIFDYPPGPPTAPTGLAVTATPVALLIDWDDNTEEDVAFYIVYRDVASPATTEIARVRSDYFVDTGVSVGTTYFYRVKAVDWTGYVSDYSNEDSGAPLEIPALDLEIEMRPWVSDLGFTYDTSTPDRDHIYWGLGGDEANTDATIDYSDGTSVGINRGNNNFNPVSDTVYYFYWDESQITATKYDVQYTTTYSTAVGAGKGLLAIIKLYTGNSEGDEPTILPFNSYVPTISGGVIAANTIIATHIKAGTITADRLSFTAYEIGTHTLDDVVDGVTYERVLATDITAGHILLSEATGDLGDIANGGGYSKVLTTDISAGHVKIAATVDGDGYSRVASTDVSAGKIKLTTEQDFDDQGFSIVSNQTTTRLEMTASYLRGLNANVEQFRVDAADGTAKFGGGVGYLDVNGLRIELDALTAGNFTDGMIRLYDTAGVVFYGALIGVDLSGSGYGTGMGLVSGAGKDLVVYSAANDDTYVIGGDVAIGAIDGAGGGIISLTSTGSINIVAAAGSGVLIDGSTTDVTITAGDDLLLNPDDDISMTPGGDILLAPTGTLSLQSTMLATAGTLLNMTLGVLRIPTSAPAAPANGDLWIE